VGSRVSGALTFQTKRPRLVVAGALKLGHLNPQTQEFTLG